MEHSDFDKILRNKINEVNDLHSKEMDTAKPFVWTEIQRRNSSKGLRWYHLAAAVVLIVLCFSWVLLSMQNNHNKEPQTLSNKITSIGTFCSE